MDNKTYRKIQIKKSNKILTGIQIKKKTKLIFCKRMFNKLKRTNSNTSTSSISSIDTDFDNKSTDDINIKIID